jgi:hypothetical protein
MKIEIKKVKGGISISTACDVCGGPIIGANEFGMYCEKHCHEAENKRAGEQLRAFLRDMENNIGTFDFQRMPNNDSNSTGDKP